MLLIQRRRNVFLPPLAELPFSNPQSDDRVTRLVREAPFAEIRASSGATE